MKRLTCAVVAVMTVGLCIAPCCRLTAEELNVNVANVEKQYTIAQYDKKWPELFEKEQKELGRVLGCLAQKIEHIGSTSVPGLSAKPIIDIIITVKNESDAQKSIGPLQKYGYKFKGTHKAQQDAPWYAGLWLSFHKNSDNGTRMYQLHLVKHNSPIYHDYIALRNYMRTHPSDALKYTSLKKNLERMYKRKRDYRKGKTPFLDSITSKAQKEYYAPIFAEYRITKYNDQWPMLYEQEKDRLIKMLGGLISSIDHIGSTSIPGMISKPTIDINISAPTKNANEVTKILVKNGYTYRFSKDVKKSNLEHPRWRRFFFKIGVGHLTYHIHLVSGDNRDRNDFVLFRDYLMQNQEAANAYASLKKKLLKKYKNREKYREGKEAFIESIISRCKSDRQLAEKSLQAHLGFKKSSGLNTAANQACLHQKIN